jgi:hypothetical protein
VKNLLDGGDDVSRPVADHDRALGRDPFCRQQVGEKVDLVVEPPFELGPVDVGEVTIKSEVMHDPVRIRLRLQGRDERG